MAMKAITLLTVEERKTQLLLGCPDLSVFQSTLLQPIILGIVGPQSALKLGEGLDDAVLQFQV